MPKDHYVMKSHLDRFILPGAKRVLYPYRKRVGLLKRYSKGCGPKGLGWARDFYAQMERDGTISFVLDKNLQEVEKSLFRNVRGQQSFLLKCAYSPDYFPSTYHERKEIAYCLVFTWARSPVQIHNGTMMSNFASNYALYVELGSKRMTSSIATKLGINEKRASEVLERYRVELVSGNARFSSTSNIQHQPGFEVFSHMGTMIEHVVNMRWRIFEAKTEDFFVTSDNPVVLENRDLPSNLHVGFRIDSTEIWYPISHRVGLFMDRKFTGRPGRFVLKQHEVRELNQKMIKWCYRHLYSPQPEAWINEAMISESFRPLLDDFKGEVMCEVVDMEAALQRGNKCDLFEEMELH